MIAIGISHKTSSLKIREKFCLDPIERELLLSELKNEPSVVEALVLSTCNRTEIYAHVLSADPEILFETLFKVKKINPDLILNAACESPISVSLRGAFFATKQSFKKIASRKAFAMTPSDKNSHTKLILKNHFYFYSGREVVYHLMQVAAGLDSLVIGEKQILGQIKDSIELSRKKGMMGKYFNILTNMAIRAGKKARAETQIDCGGSSVSWAAVEMAQKILGSLQDKSVLIIGAGKMSSLAASHLKKKGVSQIYVINRTCEKAMELARQFGGQVVSFLDIKNILEKVDVCICSAGAPHYLIEEDIIEEIMPKRIGKKLVLIDISVPRNINPAVASLKDVFLMAVDDLKNVVDGNLNKRQMAIQAVEMIIAQKVEEFYEKLSQNILRSTTASSNAQEKSAREAHRMAPSYGKSH